MTNARKLTLAELARGRELVESFLRSMPGSTASRQMSQQVDIWLKRNALELLDIAEDHLTYGK